MSAELDAEAYVDAVAPALCLVLDPAHRPGVIANFQRIATVARAVLDFPLGEEIEPGPVFTP
jgi:hypothetical protein